MLPAFAERVNALRFPREELSVDVEVCSECSFRAAQVCPVSKAADTLSKKSSDSEH